MISAAERSTLRQLTELYGLKRSYQAMDDRRISATPEATLAVLHALGAPVEHGDPRAILQHEEEAFWLQPLEPVTVAWDGAAHEIRLRLPASLARKSVELHISREDGSVWSGTSVAPQRRRLREKQIGRTKFVEATFAVAEPLPIGYHELHVRAGAMEATGTIFSAPLRCFAGESARGWGMFAPLYALREHRGKAIGDLADLEQLLTWSTVHGGDVVATLPISASFLTTPFDPSPYSPASRLYWNELFLDLERLLANTDCVPARNRAGASEWQHAMRVAAASDYVDYREIAQLKRHVLEALADWFFLQQRERSQEFTEFLALYPDAEAYARFRAACERQGRGWPAWPQRQRGGELQSHDFDDDAARYHLYAQFALHRQLEALAQRSRVEGSALYLDMPLGVHPDSFDVWSRPDLFVTGVSAGAPPDAFFTKGQNWGFPPLNPKTLRAQRYGYWRRVLRTQFRYAAMLRIDHVMSLHRLFFVPAGYEAAQGVYVRYPADELYAALTIESQRQRSAVVGEDLGTVPAEVRKSMKRHGVKRMFVVQFEATADDPPIGEPPAEAVASLNTHDMPPFAAYWNGLDAELRREIGLLTEEQVVEQRKQRAALGRALTQHLRRSDVLERSALNRILQRRPEAAEALPALLEWLARSRAEIVLLNLEDLWLEEQPQNVPGTGPEKPNWRRRMRYTLAEMRTNASLTRALEQLSAARREPKDKRR